MQPGIYINLGIGRLHSTTNRSIPSSKGKQGNNNARQWPMMANDAGPRSCVILLGERIDVKFDHTM
jgi:hypothetical protein